MPTRSVRSVPVRTATVRTVAVVAAAALAPLVVAIVPAGSPASAALHDGQGDGGAHDHGGPLTARTILSGSSLTHSFTPARASAPTSEPLTKPDDITRLGRDIFVGFQNGVGPQGEPSTPSGNVDSTVVEVTPSGLLVAQWDIVGKVDGLTADPESQTIVATVNEDANSSLYTITPGSGGGVQHYSYNEPLPHNGGTDAISVLDGRLYISASAPGTTGTLSAPQPTFPAVYTVTLDPSTSVATVTPLFNDEDPAVVANVGTPQTGQTVPLALTDPDSSEIVPRDAPRFGGEFMLDSQGDQQQIFVSPWDHELSVLNLTQSVDDTAWPGEDGGVLYATDSTNDAVDVVTGAFPERPVVAVTPCGANSAPSTCSATPATPVNYLGSLNPWTGEVSMLTVGGVAFVPQGGLLFTDGRDGGGHE